MAWRFRQDRMLGRAPKRRLAAPPERKRVSRNKNQPLKELFYGSHLAAMHEGVYLKALPMIYRSQRYGTVTFPPGGVMPKFTQRRRS